MKHLRACFIFYILLFVTVSRAQKESIADIKGINTQHEISNLKGHVKEIKSVTITNNEDQEVVQNKFYYNKDVGGPGYILYESGLLCKSYLAPAVFDYAATYSRCNFFRNLR